MTFERVYSIIRPHKAALFNTVKKAKITIPCIFVLAFSYSIPNLFVSQDNVQFCTTRYHIDGNVFGQLYRWLSEIIIIPVPFVSLLSMNSIIIHTLRKRSQTTLKMSRGTEHAKCQTSEINHSEAKIYLILLLVSFGYLIFSSPIDALYLYIAFYSGRSPYYYASLYLFHQVAFKMFLTNHGFNFFLYVMAGKKFRTDLKNLFFGKKSN